MSLYHHGRRCQGPERTRAPPAALTAQGFLDIFTNSDALHSGHSKSLGDTPRPRPDAMKIDTMKFVDHRVGLVICLLLDAWNRLTRWLHRRSRDVGDVSEILVTKYFGMGSILLATPMMTELRRRFPTARITLFTFERNRELGRILTCVDEVVSVRTDSFCSFARDLFARLWQFRRKRFDVAFDLEFFSKFSTIVTYLSGARLRVGFQLRSLWRGDLLTHPVYMNQHRHITRDFLAMAEAVGVELPDPAVLSAAPSPDCVCISPEAEARAAKIVSEGGDGPVVALNPNASELSYERRWPAERFVQLTKRLREAIPTARVFLIGGEGDRAYVEPLSRQCGPDVTSLAGQLSVEELLPFLARCDLFITNDSGPLHMAAMMGTPTLSFFGPETPEFYGPLGGESRTAVFYKYLYCSPCLSAYNVKTPVCQGDNRCLHRIGVDEVAARALSMLGAGDESAHGQRT